MVSKLGKGRLGRDHRPHPLAVTPAKLADIVGVQPEPCPDSVRRGRITHALLDAVFPVDELVSFGPDRADRPIENADTGMAGDQHGKIIGGQVGDQGVIETAEGARLVVSDVKKPVDGLFVHKGTLVEGELREGQAVSLRGDDETRRATVRNHSGTHLLHAALRKVLGSQAMQKGSLVSADRLRFDFTHDSPLTQGELHAIEDYANDWIDG